MHKFSSIGSFRNVLTGVHRFCHDRAKPLPTYDYIGTVKLHGTNAGVRRTASGKIVPQSKNRILDVTCDNYNFAKFVAEREEKFAKLITDFFGEGTDVTIYGEWAGGDIQSNVALTQIDPHFTLFNVRVEDAWSPDHYPLPPDLHDNESGIFNIFQIPYFEVSVDFSAPDAAVHEINELTNAVEALCPWGKFHGVEGIGEGIVWVPRQFPEISDLWFKTKGGKHSGKPRVKGIKAKISVEKANSITECMELVLPEWRLQQGLEHLRENHFDLDTSSTGEFLKWVNQDILKEELDTIEQNGLTWKEVQKPITGRARKFYLNFCNGTEM